MKVSKLSLTNLIAPAVLSFLQYFIIFLMIHAGSSVTREAEHTSVVVGRLMTKSDDNAVSLANFLSQIKSRDLNVRNTLFKINWNILLAVSAVEIVCGSESDERLFRLYQQS